MFGNHRSLTLSGLALAAGSIVAFSGLAQASPDDSVWYQPPQPAHSSSNHNSSHGSNHGNSHHSHKGHSNDRHHSSSYSSYRVASYNRYGSSNCYPYTSSYSRSYSSYPRYSSSYRYNDYCRTYSRPIVSVPSSSTRITYVTPVVQDTQYTVSQPSGAYDAVSYREYQRLLAEQRVLRQQIIDQQREREIEQSTQPVYNPGPPVPSNAPLSVSKETPGSEVKVDRPRSEAEILPPVPREASVLNQSEAAGTTVALAPEWDALTSGNYAYAMRLFTELSGQETASTADRVGFALAAAATGQRERAAWAMRRVLVADSAGFGFIPASDELQSTLKRLSADIARDAEARPGGPQRRMLMFLVAGTDYLVLDMESGLEHLDQAKFDGADHHEGAVRLRELFLESGVSGF